MKYILILTMLTVSVAEGGARVAAPRVRISSPKVKAAGSRKLRGTAKSKQKTVTVHRKEAQY